VSLQFRQNALEIASNVPRLRNLLNIGIGSLQFGKSAVSQFKKRGSDVKRYLFTGQWTYDPDTIDEISAKYKQFMQMDANEFAKA
jgi:hypothetical protein